MTILLLLLLVMVMMVMMTIFNGLGGHNMRHFLAAFAADDDGPWHH
jgi:hypothetical protein